MEKQGLPLGSGGWVHCDPCEVSVSQVHSDSSVLVRSGTGFKDLELSALSFLMLSQAQLTGLFCVF